MNYWPECIQHSVHRMNYWPECIQHSVHRMNYWPEWTYCTEDELLTWIRIQHRGWITNLNEHTVHTEDELLTWMCTTFCRGWITDLNVHIMYTADCTQRMNYWPEWEYCTEDELLTWMSILYTQTTNYWSECIHHSVQRMNYWTEWAHCTHIGWISDLNVYNILNRGCITQHTLHTEDELLTWMYTKCIQHNVYSILYRGWIIELN